MSEPGQHGDQPLIADTVNNQPVAARVPAHIGSGAFSTGTIVTMGGNEFVLDFVLRMGKPHRLSARVVLPPSIAAQFTSMLEKGIRSYEQHFGPAQPQVESPAPVPTSPTGNEIVTGPGMPPEPPPEVPAPQEAPSAPPQNPATPPAPAPVADASPPTAPAAPVQPAAPQPVAPTPPPVENRPGSLRNTYDELKVEDSVVCGTYANAVMVSHTESVFQFDFITNFLPYSAVASRVFLPVAQGPRLLEALRLTLRRFAAVQKQARQQQIDRARRQNEPPSSD